MAKTVWLMNHYASHMLFDKGGRHYCLAKYLNKAGYNTVIFCANIKNNKTDERYFETDNLWTVKKAEEINTPFVYVKARTYKGNGKQRVLNMIDFYKNVKKAAKEYATMYGNPDVIVASSVHPLTLIAGIQLAKKFRVKCISEVRDLWPESIVAYSEKWTRNNLLIRLLYSGEKWIYKQSDFIIMTWPGGYDYIREQGWDRIIPEDKVVHISNGVDLEQYSENLHKFPYNGLDFGENGYKSFVYTGSIKKVNNLGILLSVAAILKKQENCTARIVVFGDGDELDNLCAEAQSQGLDNILFVGRVPKQEVPSILSQSYATILHNSSTVLDKYGQSQNKFFEYLAAARPILMTYSVGHSVIREYECGIEIDVQTPEAIASAIISLCELSKEKYQQYCNSAFEQSKAYDYKVLCDKLISIISN